MDPVSVVMATYNRGWVIKRAIDSVLAQTDLHFELIVVDDGSRDNTREVLTKVKNPRVRVYNRKTNMGAAAARNFGIRKARHGLVAFLDSDNIWYPDFLAVMKSELTQGYDLAYSGQNLILAGGKNKRPLGRSVRNEPYNFTKLLDQNYIDTSSVLVRKKSLEKAGLFDTTLKTLEDWDLYARVAIHDPLRVKHVNFVLGEYYYYLKNSTRTVTNTNFSEFGIKSLFGIYKKGKDRDKITRRFNRLLKR